MLKHYVTFLFPGSFWPEEQITEISSRDEKFDIPKSCFAYEFWDREETVINGEKLVGSPKNKSGRYYFGEVMDEQQVLALYPEANTVVSNMRCNNWKKVVRTRRGNWQPLLENDVVIEDGKQ